MLSGLDTCKIVRERETLSTVFRNESRSGKVHRADQAPGIGAVGGAWGRRKHVLGVIRQSEKYEPTLLLEAWRRFEKEGTGENGNLTVQELAEKFVARQKAEGRSARTVIDDRWRLNAMTKAMGHLRVGAVKRADILRYMEGIAPGSNRRSHQPVSSNMLNRDLFDEIEAELRRRRFLEKE
jgi:hypothetical protein